MCQVHLLVHKEFSGGGGGGSFPKSTVNKWDIARNFSEDKKNRTASWNQCKIDEPYWIKHLANS